jgi:hypothetical protein
MFGNTMETLFIETYTIKITWKLTKVHPSYTMQEDKLVPQPNISDLQRNSCCSMVSKKHGNHSREKHKDHENASYIFEHHTSLSSE